MFARWFNRHRSPAPQTPPSISFSELIERWEAAQRPRLREKALTESVRSLRKDAIPLHALPIDQLNRRLIASVLTAVQAQPGRQRCLHANIRRTVRWAIGAGLLETDPTLGLKSAPANHKDRVLSGPELRAVWAASQPMGDYGVILRLLALTGQRRGEIGGLSWPEVNLDRAQIELPGSRTKNKRAHNVPLAPLALAQLPPPRTGRAYLFGNREGRAFNSWGRCKEVLDGKIGGMPPWDVHDLRRSFVTHCAEAGLAEPHVLEAVVNHQSGAKAGVAGTYNRSAYAAQKRAALEAWGAELGRIVGAG